MTDAITLKKLTKSFAQGKTRVDAVKGISLTVPQGIVFGLLGPNGAGKSTTIGMICTLAKPTKGSVQLFGVDIEKDLDTARRNLGLVFQEMTLDQELTGRQNLVFQAKLYRLDRQQERVQEALESVGLTEAADRPARGYSGGMKRRLEIARAIITDPKILLLDEPTLGLDAQARKELWESIHGLMRTRGLTVLLTTHYLEEAERMCARIAIMDQGAIIAEGTPRELIAKAALGSITVTLAKRDTVAIAALAKLAGARNTTVDDRTVIMRVPDASKAIVPVVNAAKRVGIERLELREPSLEDAYLSLTGKAFDGSDAKGKAAAERKARGKR